MNFESWSGGQFASARGGQFGSAKGGHIKSAVGGQVDRRLQYIKEHKTLPNIPSEQEIKKQNIGLGEQNRLQQEKIEELTLYAIQQQKQIDILLERLSKVETLIGR